MAKQKSGELRCPAASLIFYMQVTNSKRFFFLFLKTTITLLRLSQACAGRKACESGVKMNVNTLKI